MTPELDKAFKAAEKAKDAMDAAVHAYKAAEAAKEAPAVLAAKKKATQDAARAYLRAHTKIGTLAAKQLKEEGEPMPGDPKKLSIVEVADDVLAGTSTADQAIRKLAEASGWDVAEDEDVGDQNEKETGVRTDDSGRGRPYEGKAAPKTRKGKLKGR